MEHQKVWIAGGLAALALTLVALPSFSRGKQQGQEDTLAVPSKQQMADLRAALADAKAALAEVRAGDIAANLQELQEVMPGPDDGEDMQMLAPPEQGAGWLGVEIREVTTGNVRELKLPAERGVLLSKIMADSPAAKAGLKENDVVTEINGQRVEGAVQFRRMIHETPAGRSAQLTVWRSGRAQTISATVGNLQDAHKNWMKGLPHVSSPGEQVYAMPGMRGFEWNGEIFSGNRPRLGIDAEDLSGDFGNFFGAPEGEGILVRAVSAGSAAEKAGLKAGDVIIKYDGERIRSVGDLREKLAGLREAKEAKTVKLGVLRNHSEMTVDVIIAPPAEPKDHPASERTHI